MGLFGLRGVGSTHRATSEIAQSPAAFLGFFGAEADSSFGALDNHLELTFPEQVALGL